jgi:hypothetical protein
MANRREQERGLFEEERQEKRRLQETGEASRAGGFAAVQPFPREFDRTSILPTGRRLVRIRVLLTPLLHVG